MARVACYHVGGGRRHGSKQTGLPVDDRGRSAIEPERQTVGYLLSKTTARILLIGSGLNRQLAGRRPAFENNPGYRAGCVPLNCAWSFPAFPDVPRIF